MKCLFGRYKINFALQKQDHLRGYNYNCDNYNLKIFIWEVPLSSFETPELQPELEGVAPTIQFQQTLLQSSLPKS